MLGAASRLYVAAASGRPADAAGAPPAGNTYKAMFEATAMTSGLYFVVFINVLVAWLGILFYRYVILRQAGLLSPRELALLRKYPPVGTPQSYTPADSFVRGAPPMRWTGWRDFFAADDAHLSRDAQVYLLFQRACMATAAVCMLVSGVVLLPSYWLGGPPASRGPRKPLSLAALLRSDRGLFERLTSHNLPAHSPLVLLQIPVVAVAASCIVVLHTLVHATTRDHRTLDDWLRAPPTPSASAARAPPSPPPPAGCAEALDIGEPAAAPGDRQIEELLDGASGAASSSGATFVSPSASFGERRREAQRLCLPSETPPRAQRRPVDSFLGSSPRSPLPPQVSHSGGGGGRSGWTLFARGLPRNVRSKRELYALLDAVYPDQIRSVELVCKGRMSEARLVRTLSSARNRLDYLLDTPELDLLDPEADDGEREEANSAENGEASGDADGVHSASWWTRLLRRLFGKRPSRESLIAELTTKIASLERDVASRKREPVEDFLGCAFITVRTSEAASSLVYEFPTSWRADRVGLFDRRPNPHRPLSSDAGPPVSALLSADGEAGGAPSPIPHGDYERGGVFAFLRLDSLFRATLMMLPENVRSRLAPPGYLDPPSIAGEELALEQLLSGQPVRSAEARQAATSRLRSMKAERAPKSGDIMWSNVGISFFERTCREVLVQMFVFAGLILFTSPVAMLTALRLIFAEVSLLSDMGHLGQNATTAATTAAPTVTVARVALRELASDSARLALADLGVNDNAADDLSAELMNMLPTALTSHSLLRSMLLAYFPVVLLAFVFAVVPSVLRAISGLEGYPTHTDREMSVFRKTSFYYLMNAVLLPSLALNTASEFLEMIYKQSDGGSNVYNALPILQSLFSGDIAFFLCNYLVQLALTGSVFWLMRLPASASMMIRRRLAVTPLEAAEAKCTSIFDFPRHFSYSVAVMSMCLLFGFMAPCIWGFAFFYYVCKHAVDTYLIRYVHPRSHIDGRLPRLATTFVLVWTCVTQLALALIFYLQGRVRAGVVVALLCALTLAACVSVGPHLGNRLLGTIQRLRDILIRKFIVGPSDDHSWFAGHNTHLVASSSSSSASSVAEVGEDDPLLSRSVAQDSERLLDVLSRRQSSDIVQRLNLGDSDSEIDEEDAAMMCSFDGHSGTDPARFSYGSVRAE